MEREGDNTARLAWTQEFKAKPFGLVWDYYCATHNCGVGLEWLDEVKKYETDVTLKQMCIRDRCGTRNSGGCGAGTQCRDFSVGGFRPAHRSLYV